VAKTNASVSFIRICEGTKISTGPGLPTSFPHAGNRLPLSPYTNPVNLPTLQPPIFQFSPTQAGFRPGRSTIDQVLLLSQSIWDDFQKKRPPNRTVLATIDFFKAFDSVWHSALFHNLLTLGLLPCFDRWTRYFLSDRKATFLFRGARSRSFRIRRGVPQGSVFGPALFILYVDDLAKTLTKGTKHSL